MLTMARGQGQGYIGQGLGIADAAGGALFPRAALRPGGCRPGPDRDRFLLSTGHYSIALWAALAEAGIIPVDELVTYGADDSRLEMSTLDTTPGVEMIGGSLGHGLGQGVGQALGLRLQKSVARVFVELSDGEMQEGSTWEAAMSASHFGLDGLVALIDCNGIQADGPVVLDMEPVADKWRAFGWDVTEIDGNDMDADRRRADAGARRSNGKPKAIVLRTLPGKGVRAHRDAARSRISSASTSGNGTASSPSSSRAWEPHNERAGTERSPWARTRPSPAAGRRSTRRSAARWRSSAQKRPDIVGLTADLGKYTDILPFRDAFPDRFFNVGMAEQNLVAVAAGLARTGLMPFATTYGVFATRRAYDFVAIACAHSQPEREDRRRPARPDHRLWRHASGDRGSGADADDPRPHHHRSLRRDRDRGGDRGDRRSSTGRSTCGCCAAACRSCSIPSYRFEIGKAQRLRDGQGCRHHLDRLHDRARARRRRGAGEARHLGRACCTCRRSSRSTPRRSPTFAAGVDHVVTAENHVVVGGLASLVVETLFDAGVSKQGDAHRPARPLHRMRLGADAAGALRADDRRRSSRRSPRLR